MDHTYLSKLDWWTFKGNEVRASLLQSVCLFRSIMLFDNGLREQFSMEGRLYGDVSYTDFESHFVVASIGSRIVGTIRLTPPDVENVARSVLGTKGYAYLLAHLGASSGDVVEISRLVVTQELRRFTLGQNLIFAAIAIGEKIFNPSRYRFLGSAGNCTKQADFATKYSDFKRIPGFPDSQAPDFNDSITFLEYQKPPYTKGVAEKAWFREFLPARRIPHFESFEHSSFLDRSVIQVESPTQIAL